MDLRNGSLIWFTSCHFTYAYPIFWNGVSYSDLLNSKMLAMSSDANLGWLESCNVYYRLSGTH